MGVQAEKKPSFWDREVETLVKDLTILSSHLKKRTENEGRLLFDLGKAMLLASTAADLKGSSSLFIALSSALQNWDAGIEKGGFIGIHIATLIKTISTGYFDLLFEKISPKERALLELLFETCILLSLTAGVLIANHGENLLENSPKSDKKRAAIFYSHLMVIIANASGFLESAFSSLLSALLPENQDKEIPAKTLSLASLLALILAASKGSRAIASELLETGKKEILSTLEKIEKFLERKEAPPASLIFFHRALECFKKNHDEEFFALFSDYAKSLAIPWETIEKELKEFHIFIEQLSFSLKRGIKEINSNKTAITQTV